MRNLATVIWWLLLLLGASAPAGAKCAYAVLKVAGEIPKTISGVVNVSVNVKTPRRSFGEFAAVAQPSFEIAVPFDTFSSYSRFWGHRCNNFPSTITLAAEVNGKQVGTLDVKFKRNMSKGKGEYRLSNKLIVGMEGLKLQ